MPADATTFTLAFTAVFGAITIYLWRLDKKMGILADRIASLEIHTPGATNDKDQEEAGSKQG